MCSGFQMSSFFCLRLIHRIGNLDVASIRVIVEDKRPEKAKFLFGETSDSQHHGCYSLISLFMPHVPSDASDPKPKIRLKQRAKRHSSDTIVGYFLSNLTRKTE